GQCGGHLSQHSHDQENQESRDGIADEAGGAAGNDGRAAAHEKAGADDSADRNHRQMAALERATQLVLSWDLFARYGRSHQWYLSNRLGILLRFDVDLRVARCRPDRSARGPSLIDSNKASCFGSLAMQVSFAPGCQTRSRGVV